MTSYAAPAQVARGRTLLARLNSTTAPGAAPPAPVVIMAQSGGQIAEVLRDLNRVKVEFQLRAICAAMSVPR